MIWVPDQVWKCLPVQERTTIAPTSAVDCGSALYQSPAAVTRSDASDSVTPYHTGGAFAVARVHATPSAVQSLHGATADRSLCGQQAGHWAVQMGLRRRKLPLCSRSAATLTAAKTRHWVSVIVPSVAQECWGIGSLVYLLCNKVWLMHTGVVRKAEKLSSYARMLDVRPESVLSLGSIARRNSSCAITFISTV